MFEFDIYFPPGYPRCPPKVKFCTTGAGSACTRHLPFATSCPVVPCARVIIPASELRGRLLFDCTSQTQRPSHGPEIYPERGSAAALSPVT